jgi:hypothetical protein
MYPCSNPNPDGSRCGHCGACGEFYELVACMMPDEFYARQMREAEEQNAELGSEKDRYRAWLLGDDDGYRAMTADDEREQDAHDWLEQAPDDALEN